MRTIDEIVDRCQKSEDMFGFEQEVLVPFLPVDKVKSFLQEGVDLSEWKETELTRDVIIAEMKEYMEFAWGKAQDHRGISASRSVSKMKAWLWLLGDDEMLAFAEYSGHYKNYGAPILWKICEKYSFPIPDDEGAKNMAQGLPCYPGCDSGCGD